MKLTFEQIKGITVGAAKIIEKQDGIHFLKCTEKQTEVWMNRNPVLGKHSSISTGVRLDFHTDSKKLSFGVASGVKYEVYVNGLMRAQYDMSENREVTLELGDPLGQSFEGDRRVTLYFPAHDITGVLKWIELDDGSYATRHKFDRKFLFIGDSITQGCAAQYDSLSYAHRVSRFFNAESVIQGTGGTYYNEEAFDHIDFEPDTVFLAFGTNDFGFYKTYDELRMHAGAYMDLVAEKYRGKKIFVISPIWRDRRDGKAMGDFAGCRQVIIDEAVKRDFIHIDGLTLVPPMPEFFKDAYIHPNDNGFSIYAENLIAQIVKYF